jgi:hypothetical protein
MVIGLMEFTIFQKERVFRGELSNLTSLRYHKPVIFFLT